MQAIDLEYYGLQYCNPFSVGGIMENLYIDESGSMTIAHCEMDPFFIISVLRVNDVRALKRVHDRFVSKNMDALRAANAAKRGTMFNNDRFLELKGSCLTPDLKHNFVKYLCQNDRFDLFYIIADNSKVYPSLYANTARGFNYLVKLALHYWFDQGFIRDEGWLIQVDERNERTGRKHFLQDYLNTELVTSGILKNESVVQYYDSSNNKLIQIADVFANLMYSEIKTGNYKDDFDFMRNEGYLKHTFRFPLR